MRRGGVDADGAILAWIARGGIPDGDRLRAQAFSTALDPRGPVLEIASYPESRMGPSVPHAIATPSGVLVYVAQRDPEIYATLLTCTP